METHTIGAPHIHDVKATYHDTPKQENLVVVFSQKIVGIELLRFVAETARLRPDLKFVLKLHPAERYQDVTTYIDGSVPSNFSLASAFDNTYELMAKARYQMGVSSTTLVEGLCFSNRVVVVPLPSWEYLQDMINDGAMDMATTPDEAAGFLNEREADVAYGERFFAVPRADNLPIRQVETQLETA